MQVAFIVLDKIFWKNDPHLKIEHANLLEFEKKKFLQLLNVPRAFSQSYHRSRLLN